MTRFEIFVQKLPAKAEAFSNRVTSALLLAFKDVIMLPVMLFRWVLVRRNTPLTFDEFTLSIPEEQARSEKDRQEDYKNYLKLFYQSVAAINH